MSRAEDRWSVYPVAMLSTAVILVGLFSAPAAAQRRIPHYQRTPRLSPYTQLFRGDTGGINSYYQFVRPQQEFQRFLDQQMRLNSRYDQAILGGPVGMGVAGVPAPLQGGVGPLQQRPASVLQAQPKPAATFNYLDHYYPTSNLGVAGGGIGQPGARQPMAPGRGQSFVGGQASQFGRF